jgi:hypothetical protein
MGGFAISHLYFSEDMGSFGIGANSLAERIAACVSGQSGNAAHGSTSPLLVLGNVTGARAFSA